MPCIWQARLGILIDRARIVESINEIATDAAKFANVEGTDKLPELKTWVDKAVTAIQKAG